jgi:hypothetical protein
MELLALGNYHLESQIFEYLYDDCLRNTANALIPYQKLNFD